MNPAPPCFFRLRVGITIAALVAAGTPFAQTAQEHIQHKSHQVMPFELSATVHIFKMTETGGEQRVLIKDARATEQIVLIQQHLRHEAAQFAQGNYTDPAMLHGADMPGLKDLQALAASVTITYNDMPLGASLTFATTDLRALTAIHRWFGAQLSEHGADARAE